MTHRPLVNLRDRPIADNRYSRNHDSAGESGFSPFVLALDAASNSIIWRAIEVGIDFSDLWVDDPVAAMKLISGDVTLKRTIRLSDGRSMTGVDMQLALAERAYYGAHAAENLTEQEEEWGRRWIDLLQKLQRHPHEASDDVNWVSKLVTIDRGLAKTRPRGVSDVAQAWRYAANHDLLLPAEGVGMKLLRKGMFTDSPSADMLDQGLALPDTRAKLRAQAIGYLTGRRINHSAWWTQVRRRDTDRQLILTDPYESRQVIYDNFVAEAA